MEWVIAFQFCAILGLEPPQVQKCQWEESPHPKFASLEMCENFRHMYSFDTEKGVAPNKCIIKTESL